MTSFIVDTGAGLNIKCYAKGSSTREVNDLAMMSANGVVQANQVTTVKFRNINDQDCVILDNCPNVLSVGQLVSQGYDFIWLSDPSKKSKETLRAAGTEFDAASLLVTNPYELCYSVTPYGKRIHLSVSNRVPYYNDNSVHGNCPQYGVIDNSDLASEPDYELFSAVVDVRPVESNGVVVSGAPAAHRIAKKSTIELTDHQQTLLDHAVSRQILKSIDTHDILH